MLRFVTKRLTSAKAWMPVCFSNFCGIIDGQVMHIVSHWGGLNFKWHIQSTMIILLTKQPVGTVLGSCCRAEMSVCENRKQSWTLLRTWKKKKPYKSWWLTLCTYDADISHLCTHTHMCPLSVTHKHTCMHTCKQQICLIVSWEDGAVQRRYLPPVSGGIHVLSVQSVLIGKQISSSAHKPTSTPAPPLACFCDFTVFSCCWWLLQDGAVNLPSLPYTFLRDIG